MADTTGKGNSRIDRRRANDAAEVEQLFNAAMHLEAVLNPLHPDDSARFARIAADVALKLGAPQATTSITKSGERPFGTLGDLVRDRKSDIGSVAAAVGLPRTVLIRLGRGLIDIESVPAKVFEFLAVELRTSAEAIVDLLSGSPRLAPQANFLAMEAPRTPRSQTFQDALMSDREVSDEMLRAWLPEDGVPEN